MLASVASNAVMTIRLIGLKMQHITTVILDLDDTLWDLPAVINHAENTIYEWFSLNYPKVTQQYSVAQLRQLRVDVSAEFPEMHHDLMFLREQTYLKIAATCGYPDSLSAEAFAVFQTARNQVTLFDDVEPVLRVLATTHRLVALSNGNADLREIGLAGYFSAIYSARDIGLAKPDPKIFYNVCERLHIEPEEVLHVGDNPYNDIHAPRQIGMSTVWVNRRAQLWPDDIPAAEFEISDLVPLGSILRR